MVKHENISFNQDDFSIKTTAFLGVISASDGLSKYMLFESSVNTDKFIEFLKSLIKLYKGKKIAIYMDNLQVHKTLKVKDFLQENNVPVIFAPVY